MSHATHKARESFVADLVRAAPEKATVWHATRLLRYGDAIDRLFQKTPWTPKNLQKYQRLYNRSYRIAEMFGCTVEVITRSPRLEIITATGERIGVPTS